MSDLSIFDLMHKKISEKELIKLLEKENINAPLIVGNLAFNGFYDEDWLDLLVKYGLDVNYKTESGENPLWYTNYISSEILIKRGADFNHIDHAGRNALWYCYHDDKKYKVLTDAGINVNLIDNCGENVLFIAPVQMFDFLIEKGADPYIVNNKKENLLFRNDIEIWKFFEGKGIVLDYNMQDYKGMNLFEKNISDGHEDRIKFLRERVLEKDKTLLYLLSYISEGDSENLAMNSKIVLFSEIFDDCIKEENLLERNKNGYSLFDLMIEITSKMPYALDINMSSLKNIQENCLLRDKLDFSEDSDDYDEYSLLSNKDYKAINKILNAIEEKIIIEKEINIQNDPMKIKKRI